MLIIVTQQEEDKKQKLDEKEMYHFKLKYGINMKERSTEEKYREARVAFFQMFYIFDDSRKEKKTKVQIYLSFLS